MAVVLTAKAMNLCSRLQVAASDLMSAVERLAALKDEKESSGIDFTTAPIETALDTAFPHTDGVDWNNVLTSGAAINTFMVGANHDDILQKVRP